MSENVNCFIAVLPFEVPTTGNSRKKSKNGCALASPSLPSVCRRVTCNIGGHAEVRSAIEAAEVAILATRTQAGVLAFGAENDVRIAFSDNTIEEFDLHTIEVRRLRYDGQERGLLRQARAMRSRANMI
ncbi:hypothetical protein [Mesorhizobium tianshanense]|uniref:hypothetical protein n=1 Tax=Mesorhizobium tianshanense TaxID=39844 RepID=UPI00119F1586|nr:hypothetical protein [Mesorhizobium tianshanense]